MAHLFFTLKKNCTRFGRNGRVKKIMSELSSPLIPQFNFFLTKCQYALFPNPSLTPTFGLFICSIFLKSNWHYATILILSHTILILSSSRNIGSLLHRENFSDEKLWSRELKSQFLWTKIWLQQSTYLALS